MSRRTWRDFGSLTPIFERFGYIAHIFAPFDLTYRASSVLQAVCTTTAKLDTQITCALDLRIVESGLAIFCSYDHAQRASLPDLPHSFAGRHTQSAFPKLPHGMYALPDRREPVAAQTTPSRGIAGSSWISTATTSRAKWQADSA